MDKAYLDVLYSTKHKLILEREQLQEKLKAPMVQCCEKMSVENPLRTKLTENLKAEDDIDLLIETYILLHSESKDGQTKKSNTK